ncbi:MAG TPA: HAD family hydrolase [Candidatus Didemnitutus sp.]|nr:HAD family hydrolase [Candidatus Didemnitutus sp.]
MSRRYVMLDRDGTLIVERHYLSDPAQVELLPGAAAGLRELQELGLGLIVVTNQSGVGRGYFTRTRLDEIHRRMTDLLAAEGVTLDGTYVCPHTPEDNCSCRKPQPGLVTTAAAELGFDPTQGFMIGDKPCDVELGQAVGAPTFLVRTGYGAKHEADASLRPDHVVDDIPAAAGIIARLLSASDVDTRP